MNAGFEMSTSENLMLSGGANGADYKFGKYAHENGHAVIHWTFDGHHTKCPPQHVIRLSKEQLAVADSALKRANKSLNRTFPGKKDFSNNLLRRNYYQVKWTEAVYAVGYFEHGQVKGGTSWATQMYMDRFLCDNEYFEKCHLYLYDQHENQWMQWYNGWETVAKPPKPSGVYTGIGSRDITDDGINAIADLYK